MADEERANSGGARQAQLLVSFGLLLCLAVQAVALDLLARNRAFFDWTVRAGQNIERARKSRYSYAHYFVDFEDRLINEEMWEADYSRGGVYLFGTSNLKWATKLWELPERQAALIHNYGIGATSHLFQFQLLRFLVEHDGLLAAGGDKNMVVFGLSWHAVGPEYSPQEFFPNLWNRHGLYSYDVKSGIAAVEADRLWRWIHFERVRIAGVVRTTSAIAAHQLGYGMGVRQLKPAEYVRERAGWSGADWERRMNEQLSILDTMMDYLQSRDVKVVVALVPQGTWEDALPFQRSYAGALREICERRAIPLKDWSKLLNDDDFADSNHLTPSGVDKVQPKVLEIALPFLHATGAL